MPDLKVFEFRNAATPAQDMIAYVAVMHDIADIDDRGAPTGKFFVLSHDPASASRTVDCGFDPELALRTARQLCLAPAARGLTVLRQEPFIAVRAEDIADIFNDRGAVLVCFRDKTPALPVYCETADRAKIEASRLREKLQVLRAGIATATPAHAQFTRAGNIITPAAFVR